MPPVDWYFARGSKQMGPVSSAELKRLAGSGELRPNDLVWREGLAEWTLARNVHGLFQAESKPADVVETSPAEAVASSEGVAPAEKSPQKASPRGGPRHLVEMALDSLRSAVSARFVEAMARLARRCGLYGLLAAMVLVAALTLIESVQAKTLDGLLSGVALLLLLAVLHYLAGKFCDALERLNRITPGSLVSTALPDSVAILSLAAGMGALFGSVALSGQSWTMILPGIAALVVCLYLAFVALNPATLNVWIAAEEPAASEEAIGVLLFLLKAMLALAPVAFGAGVVCGTIWMGLACGQALAGGEGLALAPITAAMARTDLIYFAALPLAAYLLFLPCILLLNLCRTILSLPEKLDKLSISVEQDTTGEQ